MQPISAEERTDLEAGWSGAFSANGGARRGILGGWGGRVIRMKIVGSVFNAAESKLREGHVTGLCAAKHYP